MKKVLVLALGMLLVPFTAFGMQTMDEAAMDSVTGQSGVAISVDNIGIYSSGETVWYQGGSDEAWVGITAGDEVTLINAHTSPSDLTDDFSDSLTDELGDGSTYGEQYFNAQALMIQTQDSIWFLGGAEGVLITLGTLDIRTYQGGSVTTIGLGEGTFDDSDDTYTAPTEFSSTFGRMSATDGQTVILGGQIGITTVDAYEGDE